MRIDDGGSKKICKRVNGNGAAIPQIRWRGGKGARPKTASFPGNSGKLGMEIEKISRQTAKLQMRQCSGIKLLGRHPLTNYDNG